MDDPKMFAARCKPGMEKETVAQILNKFLMHKNLHIFSATFVEKFPGYIYIEAEREIHVKDAIGDLNGTTFKGRAYCRIIPIKEVYLKIVGTIYFLG